MDDFAPGHALDGFKLEDEMAGLPSTLASLMDHTILKAEATQAQIIKLCEEAREYGFATVCLNPCWVSLAAEILEGSPVKVCTVVGFPLGANTTQTKVEEARRAVADGAEEVDMVINVGALLGGEFFYVGREIADIAKAAKPASLKVIIESAALTDEQIVKVCEIAVDKGAAYVKTSTGFHPAGGASAEAVALMRKTVGEKARVKASGGIRDFPTALAMVAAGADRLGVSASVAIIEQAKKQELSSELGVHTL